MKVKKVVIPAAGLGTRFLPATKAQPKEMLPIVDTPTIQYIVKEALEAGVEDIIIISGRGKRAIEDHFDKSYELEDILKQKNNNELLKVVEDISGMANIYYVRQKEPKGLGHAILCAKSFIGNEPFGVMLGDDVVYSQKPAMGQLIDVYDKCNCTIVGVQEVPAEDVSNYGIIDGAKLENGLFKVNNMVEKPDKDKAPSRMAILGRYIISPKIFHYLENSKPGKGGEIQLTDALKDLIEEEDIFAYEFEGKRYDVGKKLGFLQATIEYALRREDLKTEFSDYIKEVAKNL